jgi:DNA-binding transcriptional ArsR family regulator
MIDQDARVEALEAQLATLARRVERLEGGRAREHASEPAATDLSFLEQLRSRRGSRYRAADARGAIAYAGAAGFGDRESLWIREHAVPEILALEPERLVRAFGALGHPARLVLLRALLARPHSSSELQGVLGVSSPGPLYHHLKELLATGLVTQTGRSQYEVAVHHVVPLLAVLAAVSDLVYFEESA